MSSKFANNFSDLLLKVNVITLFFKRFKKKSSLTTNLDLKHGLGQVAMLSIF